MKRSFSIYPSLFVLTPVKEQETIQTDNGCQEADWRSEDDRYFTSYPQTYWGKCLFTGDQTQFMFEGSDDEKACPVQSIIGGRVNTLEPAKFKGKNYTITYIPVLN